MRLHFTEEDAPARERARDLRAGLAHAGHRVSHGRHGTAPPRDADVWFLGLGWNPLLPIDLPLSAIDRFRGELVIFQVCDHRSMHFHRLPDSVVARARLFLRNHWPRDLADVPAAVRDRLGLVPPMNPRARLHRGLDLAARGRGAMFFGSSTGDHFRPADGEAPRVATVRAMRASGLPFEGGIVAAVQGVSVPDDVVAARIGDREHAARLRDAKVCLAPWGNHPLTYRLFEGLAARCLVVAQSLAGERFVDAGLQAGTHYLEVAADLSNLVDVVREGLDDLDRAQRIADAGHELYAARLARRGGLPSEHVMETCFRSWQGLLRPPRRPSLSSRARGLLAMHAPSWL